jgi:hypothetical protein
MKKMRQNAADMGYVVAAIVFSQCQSRKSML